MKKSMLTVVALAAIVALFFAACSSDDSGPSTVGCNLSNGTCIEVASIEQCTSAGGAPATQCTATPSSNSGGGSSILACLVGGVSCIPVLDKATCDAASGSIVKSCQGSDQFVNCEIANVCTPVQSAQVCQMSTGTVVATCPGSGGNPGNNNSSSSVGGNPGNNNSSSSVGGNPGNNNSSSSRTTGGEETVNCKLVEYGICTDVLTAAECTSMGGTQVVSCTPPPKPKLFCDFGYPTTSGGGCYPISTASECDTEYGQVATKCGQRNDQFCQWSSTNECHLTASTSKCQTDYGASVSLCPISTLDEDFYCYYGGYEEDCSKIGGKGYSRATDCASDGGAIVKRAFCVENEIPIFLN
ncbi:MAG: hypothetical protein FWB90_05940 [Fibromonadales bacterium]|nr:hypothetical protein [Fibromonadales bacterium]